MIPAPLKVTEISRVSNTFKDNPERNEFFLDFSVLVDPEQNDWQTLQLKTDEFRKKIFSLSIENSMIDVSRNPVPEWVNALLTISNKGIYSIENLRTFELKRDENGSYYVLDEKSYSQQIQLQSNAIYTEDDSDDSFCDLISTDRSPYFIEPNGYDEDHKIDVEKTITSVEPIPNFNEPNSYDEDHQTDVEETITSVEPEPSSKETMASEALNASNDVEKNNSGTLPSSKKAPNPANTAATTDVVGLLENIEFDNMMTRFGKLLNTMPEGSVEATHMTTFINNVNRAKEEWQNKPTESEAFVNYCNKQAEEALDTPLKHHSPTHWLINWFIKAINWLASFVLNQPLIKTQTYKDLSMFRDKTQDITQSNTEPKLCEHLCAGLN